MPLSEEEKRAWEICEAKIRKRRTKPSVYDLEELYNSLKNFNHLSLPSVIYAYRANLPEESGIYFAYKDNEIYYIGQSTNMKTRWASHNIGEVMTLAPNLISDPDLRIGWMLVPNDLLDFAEKYLIGVLHPILNIMHREPI